MAIETFGAIYIGSYEVSLKIFELSSKKNIREVDHIRTRIDLGRDVYKYHKIGSKKVEDLCEILLEFSEIMKGYRVDSYEVYAAAVLRDASNELFVVHQIFLRTGFSINVISNSEYRFLGYRSVAGKEQFEKLIQTSAAVVHVGGSGIQITLFKDGQMINTQHLSLGTFRLRELLYEQGISSSTYQTQIEEYINKKLEVLRSLYLSEGIENIVFLSDYCDALVHRMDKKEAGSTLVSSERFIKFLDKLRTKTIEEICKELKLSNDKDPLILPSIMLFYSLTVHLGSSTVWVPGVDINDGIALDYALRRQLIKSTHDFDKDVISQARYLSTHYLSYSPHIDALSTLSIQIFDTMKKIHGMSKRERLLLQVAVILHDCGKYISLANSAHCAYEVIMATEMIGLSHKEREIIAYTVLFNNEPLCEYEEISDHLSKEDYFIVAKLSAILRVANALDQSHKQKFKEIHMAVKEKGLIITIDSLDDISLEQALFEARTEYFENVFSVKTILKEKRVMN